MRYSLLQASNASELNRLTAALFGFAISFVVLTVFIFPTPVFADNISISASQLYDSTNQTRSELGLNKLSVDSRLEKAAYSKARHMLDGQYWAHFAPDGSSPWQFIEDAGYSYTHAGENLAKNFSTSEGIHSGWLNSPTHYDNIVGDYDHIGIATIKGTFEGHETVLVVAMYAENDSTTVTSENSTENSNTINNENYENSDTATTSDNSDMDKLNEQVASEYLQKNQSLIKRIISFISDIFASKAIFFDS